MPDFRERVAARDYARNHAIAYRKDNNTLRPWLAYAECRRAGVPIPPPATCRSPTRTPRPLSTWTTWSAI
jgi:hypothetical protein